MKMKTVGDAIESIRLLRPGEVVIVEHTSLDPVHLTVLLTILSRKDDMHIVISDIFDQLHVVRSHLAIIGIDTSWMDEIPVVKFGGIMQTGRVLKRINLLNTVPVWHMEYTEALKDIPGPRLILTLGFEKLITISSELPASTIGRLIIASSMGREDEINIMFVNMDMLEESILEDIRELATRVFELELREGKLILRIVKSLSLKNYGRELSVDASELIEYLSGMKPEP